MKNILLIITVAGLLVASCKSSKNTSTKKNTTEESSSTSISEKNNIQNQDSLFASLTRTACFGGCPVYSITIYNSGYVLYEGKNFVDNKGLFETRITKEQMNQIKEKALAIKFYDMKDEYNSQITDLPSVITEVNFDGKKKRIKNRHRGPEELKEYEHFFDSLFENIEWKTIKAVNDK